MSSARLKEWSYEHGHHSQTSSGSQNMSEKQRIEISVVLPVYKCGQALEELHARLTKVMTELSHSYEIIFVDDGCPNEGWRAISALANNDDHVVAVKLSRNFGQAIAIAAGLAESKGDHVVVMDADLQDPPEAIPILWNKAMQGAQLVFARRTQEHQSFLRTFAGRIYFAFLRLISGRSIDPNYGTFTLMSRAVVEAYIRFKEPNRHFLFILYWLGFDSCDVEYARQKRELGKSSYRWLSLMRHSFQGVLFYSQSLVRLMVLFTLGMILVAAFMFISTVAGFDPFIWKSLFSVFIVFLALTVLMGGVFLGQIFEQTKDRPLYVVMKKINGSYAE